MSKKEITKDIKGKIAEVCKEVVLQDEIVKLKQQLQQQLPQAKQKFDQARQAMTIWSNKIHELSVSIATCNTILENSQKVKTLELEGDNTKPEKK